MTAEEATRIVGMLAAAHPAWKATTATVALWVELLEDLPYEPCRTAARRLIATTTEWPSVALLRQATVEELGLLPPEVDRAWALVRGPDPLDDPTVADVVAGLGGLRRLGTMDETSARIAFVSAYKAARERAVIHLTDPASSTLRHALVHDGTHALPQPKDAP